MPDEDAFPTFEIGRSSRGWKIVQVHADGSRSFIGQHRYDTEEQARAHLEAALPRMRRLWDRAFPPRAR